MLRLLIPAYQQVAKPMKPTMTAIHHCTLARFTRDLLRFLAALSNVCHHAHKIARTSSSSYPCPNTSVAVAPPSAAVAPRKCSPASHAMSWRRAPSIVTTMGTPCPSIVNDRLTPAFLRSVGFGPVFPPSGALVTATQPCPVNALQFIKARRRPATASETRQQRPMRESDHRPWICTQICPVQRRPLRAAHKRWRRRTGGWARAGDRRQTDVYSREQAGAVAAPPRIRPRCESRCGPVVWCGRTGALWCWFDAHASCISIISG